MAGSSTASITTGKVVNLVLPLFLLALLIALCVQLLVPFVGLLVWTIILAICFNPLQERMLAHGWRPGRAAMVLGTVIVAIILIPTSFAAIHAAGSIPPLVAGIQDGTLHVRPPPPALEGVPVVGAKAHAAWAQAANDFPSFLKDHGPQLKDWSRWMLKEAGGMFGAVLLLVLAVVFAAVALAYAKGLRAFFTAIFSRITGSRQQGEHLMDIIGATVRSVANGVIGVAFVQALLVGIGFFVAGVPFAGLLSLLAFLLGIVQVPVLIVTLPAIAWGFSAMDTTSAIIFTIWSLIAGLSDAALKPLLIGHGLEVPMPVILLGVIGGVIAYGLVGLFIGAVVLAVGYVLFREWLDAPTSKATDEEPTLRAAE